MRPAEVPRLEEVGRIGGVSPRLWKSAEKSKDIHLHSQVPWERPLGEC